MLKQKQQKYKENESSRVPFWLIGSSVLAVVLATWFLLLNPVNEPTATVTNQDNGQVRIEIPAPVIMQPDQTVQVIQGTNAEPVKTEAAPSIPTQRTVLQVPQPAHYQTAMLRQSMVKLETAPLSIVNLDNATQNILVQQTTSLPSEQELNAAFNNVLASTYQQDYAKTIAAATNYAQLAGVSELNGPAYLADFLWIKAQDIYNDSLLTSVASPSFKLQQQIHKLYVADQMLVAAVTLNPSRYGNYVQSSINQNALQRNVIANLLIEKSNLLKQQENLVQQTQAQIDEVQKQQQLAQQQDSVQTQAQAQEQPAVNSAQAPQPAQSTPAEAVTSEVIQTQTSVTDEILPLGAIAEGSQISLGWVPRDKLEYYYDLILSLTSADYVHQESIYLVESIVPAQEFVYQHAGISLPNQSVFQQPYVVVVKQLAGPLTPEWYLYILVDGEMVIGSNAPIYVGMKFYLKENSIDKFIALAAKTKFN